MCVAWRSFAHPPQTFTENALPLAQSIDTFLALQNVRWAELIGDPEKVYEGGLAAAPLLTVSCDEQGFVAHNEQVQNLQHVCVFVDGNLGSALPVLAFSDRLAPRTRLQHTGWPIARILLLRAVARPSVRHKLAAFFASLQADVSHALHTIEGAEVHMRHNQLRALSHDLG